MSVTTSVRMNADQLAAQLPAGAYFTVDVSQLGGTRGIGDALTIAGPKTITAIGATDGQLQAAITAAAAAFVDLEANRLTLINAAGSALAANATYLAVVTPTNAQVVAQVAALTRQVNGVIRLLLRNFTGTG